MALPQNKSAQAAQHLKEQIVSGTFGDALPSERALSDKLLISRNCVRDALEILTKEGVIAAPNRSRRRTILSHSTNHLEQKITRCVVLTPNPEYKSTEQLLGQLARLRYLLTASNIEVEVKTTQAFRHADPSRELNDLACSLPNTVWVLHLCPKAIHQWFELSGLPTLIMGSAFPDIDLPAVDSDHAAIARHATGKLLSLGHRRIGMILPRSELAGANLAEQGFNEVIAQSNHEVAPLIMRHDFNVPRLTKALENIFSKPERPTALIIQNIHHFLTAYSHLLAVNVRIPADVSLVCMASSPTFDRLSPSPAHYTTGTKFIRALATAIPRLATTKVPSKQLIPDFVDGQSLARLPG